MSFNSLRYVRHLILPLSLLCVACQSESTQADPAMATDPFPPLYEAEQEFWAKLKVLGADFNADGEPDTVRTLILDGKRGIRFTHGGTGERYQMGAGEPFGQGGDDWRWVDYWEIINDTLAYRQTFGPDGDVSGEIPVKLEGPALLLGQHEAGSIVIAWLEGGYRWIPQAD
jgi:hypothetical protein